MIDEAYNYLICWVQDEDTNIPMSVDEQEKERDIIYHLLEVQHLSYLEMRPHLVPKWMTSQDYREFLGLFFIPAAI